MCQHAAGFVSDAAVMTESGVRGSCFSLSLTPYVLRYATLPSLKIATPTPVTWAAFMKSATAASICEDEILLPSSRVTDGCCANTGTKQIPAVKVAKRRR